MREVSTLVRTLARPTLAERMLAERMLAERMLAEPMLEEPMLGQLTEGHLRTRGHPTPAQLMAVQTVGRSMPMPEPMLAPVRSIRVHPTAAWNPATSSSISAAAAAQAMRLCSHSCC